MWQSKREISRECNDIIGSAKGSQISEKCWREVGKGKRADVYLEVRKRRGHIFFEWNKCLCKLPIGGKFKDKQNGWFRKEVLVDQFPSKTVEVFRQIGWVSIPSKSIKILWQSFWCRFTRSKNFVKENFHQVYDRKLWSCKRTLFF